MPNQEETRECQIEFQSIRDYRSELPAIVEELFSSCGVAACFDHVGTEPIPSKSAIIGLINQLQRILFPGYFIPERLDYVNLRYYLGQEMVSLFEELSAQIALCVRHECLRHNLPCSQCEERGRAEALQLIKELPGLRVTLAKDVRAALEGDPAATSDDEIIFSYPGLLAITIYRIANFLYKQNVALMPRIMSEYAHGLTGIDIHPGAKIGEGFFIDHGVGVVIGETAEIGDRVRIYQGVTLGALALPKSSIQGMRRKKRHPTVEDDVIIYAGATILGGETVIGARCVIGGNVWLTQSVPPDTRVYVKTPDLILKKDAGNI
jgi:serine O-acetyltransferase